MILPKKERGRPLERKYPPRIDATAEEIVAAMFRRPADREWQYEKETPEYRCANCGHEVNHPETLYRDGRCEACHAVAVKGPVG